MTTTAAVTSQSLQGEILELQLGIKLILVTAISMCKYRISDEIYVL